MRATEACSLQVKDFDISTDTVYLHLERLKGSNATVQPLMPETAALLLEWVKDKQPEDYLFPAGRPSAVPHISRIRFFQVFRAYCRQAASFPSPLLEARTRHTRDPHDWDTAHSAIP